MACASLCQPRESIVLKQGTTTRFLTLDGIVGEPSRRSRTKNSPDGGISNKPRLPAGLSLTLGAPASRTTCDSSDRSPSSSSTTISPALCILYKTRFRKLLTVLPARCNVRRPSTYSLMSNRLVRGPSSSIKRRRAARTLAVEATRGSGKCSC